MTEQNYKELEKQMKECEQIAEWLEELKQYKNAEEQGLLFKLPCKIRDTVYIILKRLSKNTGTVEKYIEEAYIYEIEIFEQEILFKNNKTYSFQPKDVGKSVFLTKEEAEQALKDMGSEG